MWKFVVALAAIFTGAQQPIAQSAVAHPEPIAELPVFTGIQSNTIPEQCPLPHFQEQCLADEITRANAQRALTQLDDGLTHNEFHCGPELHYHYPSCVVSHFKSYTAQELKLLHKHVTAHACTPNDFMTNRRREAADMLFLHHATSDEFYQDRLRYWNSDSAGHPCGKKKLQQRARRMRNQERNQNAAAE